jgi:CRP-like cAMP-binding protein
MDEVLKRTPLSEYDIYHMIQVLRPLPKEVADLLPSGLHAHCVASQHARGERIFAMDKKPAFMFFVVSGEVVLERPGLHGESVILQRTRYGFVGEASLQSARYHCDGKVVASGELIRLPIRELQAALASDSAFALRWIGMLNREVRRLRMQCERLSLHKVEDRLRHLLETEGKDGRYPLGAGLKSLAGELGVTHEALYRCISGMEKKGQLRREDGVLMF